MQKRQKTVLIADDEAMIRDIIKRKLLAATDFSIVEAEDGQDALEKLGQHRIDLVITDIKMPRMTGIELLGEMRQAGFDIPVIVITGYGTLNDAIEALRLGAANFVKKPFQANELLSVIDKVFTVHEEKVFLRDIVPFIKEQKADLELPNDHHLFQGAITFANEVLRNCWPEYISSMLDVKICIYEALLNAFEHGNLEITSAEKEKALNEDPLGYEKYLSDRTRLEPYSNRKIRLHFDVNSETASFVVNDEGPGFDYAALPDPTDPENLMRNLGRGLLLINSIMDEAKFNESGNEITMKISREKIRKML